MGILRFAKSYINFCKSQLDFYAKHKIPIFDMSVMPDVGKTLSEASLNNHH